MEELELKRVSFKYETTDGDIHKVNLDEIAKEIGFEYNIPENVLCLTEFRRIIEIRINGLIVWESK
jgi:hypothetical protein